MKVQGFVVRFGRPVTAVSAVANHKSAVQCRTVGVAAKMLVWSHHCTYFFASTGAICALKEREGCFEET